MYWIEIDIDDCSAEKISFLAEQYELALIWAGSDEDLVRVLDYFSGV